MDNDPKPLASKGRTRFFVGGIMMIAVVIVILVALLVKQRAYLKQEIQTRAAAVESGPRVRVASATRSGDTRTVSLLGEARPYATVTLYSKVSGYLRSINVDRGDTVTAGQLLAVVESPELDRQYDAARADARSKHADAKRNEYLLKTQSISPQTMEHADAAAQVAEETAASLLAQKDYESIRAPFSGTITARFADPGALVQSAVSSQTTALPVLTLSQIDRLRVYVYPDQKTASFVKVGDRAEISDSARPGVRISGAISRTSGELDPKTRTLLVEIDVDNREGKIVAGSFVQVTLWLKTERYVEIPAEALVVRGDKSYVAVLTPDSTMKLRPIKVHESDGKVIRLESGLKEGENIILNVGDNISDGAKVRPISATGDSTRLPDR